MEKTTLSARLYLLVLTLLTWFALIAQLVLHLQTPGIPKGELVIRFFTYFTITTNLIIAICSTAILWNPAGGWGRFFAKQTTCAAITVYIVVVGLIYNTILRSIWNPTGLQLVVDQLLHTIIPVLYLLFWLIFVPKDQLQWKNVWPWLIYPLLYTIIVMARGPFSGFYPYPFIDIDKLGITRVLINAVGIAALFAVFSLLFIGIGKMAGRKG